MIKDGFTINECDKCVYTKTLENTCIIICLYVDDMLILETILKSFCLQNICYSIILTWRIWELLM